MPYIRYSSIDFHPRRLKLIETANEIIAEYSDAGYTLTLRQLYYQFVSRDLIENSERSYKNLGNAITDGRMAGLIDWNAIEDRGRGIEPWLIQESTQQTVEGLEHRFALDYWSRQGIYVEVWVEKDALSSVVARACESWRVPYMACRGYLSASEAWRSGQRFESARYDGRDCVLIHLGDHDPSGIDMTRDNDERVQLLGGYDEVEVRRIALNRDQIDRYRPPPNPAKVTDSRAGDYIKLHGPLSWELDALNPRVLDTLIQDEIRTLVDVDIRNDTYREEKERREILAQFHPRYDEIVAYLNRKPEDYVG